jgi:hypothetical protein
MEQMGGTYVLLGDQAIETTDESVRTTDESVRTTEEAVFVPVVTLDLAAEALLSGFGPLVDAEYLAGKTRFRDALCERFDLSQAEAEEIVDGLEGSGRIRFVESDEGIGFHIAHREAEA